MSAPPPPPPSSPPPPASSPYGGGKPAFDPKSVNQKDWAIMGIAALVFIFSFFDWYSYSPTGCGGIAACDSYSLDGNAWNGFLGWFATLLVVIGGAAVALDVFAPTSVKLPAPARLIGLGTWALGALLMIIAIFAVPGLSVGGIDVPDSAYDSGHDWAFWVALILVLGGLAVSFLRFQETGGKLPTRSNPPRA